MDALWLGTKRKFKFWAKKYICPFGIFEKFTAAGSCKFLLNFCILDAKAVLASLGSLVYFSRRFFTLGLDDEKASKA